MRTAKSENRVFSILKRMSESVGLEAPQKAKRAANQSGQVKAATLLLVAFTAMILVTDSIIARQQNRPAQRETPGNQAGAAEASDKKSTSGNPTNLSLESQQDYRISPDDVVEIKIEKAEELSGSYVVGKSGSFMMPFLGRIVAQGKTGDDLVAQIADGLRGRYLVDPIVKVTVQQHQKTGQSYFIQGAVRSPGHFQVIGRPTLLELITLAGGLADNHGSSAFVIRKIKPSPATDAERAAPTSNAETQLSAAADEVAKFELVKANINGLLKGNFDNNIVLEPGDNINIPPTDIFFVAGEVHAPGSFPLKEGTTLRQAISLAQGTTFKAKAGDGIIYRENPVTGKREEIKIDVGAVMNGKKEDLLLSANDVILVPNSRIKSISNAVLTTFGYTATRVIRY